MIVTVSRAMDLPIFQEKIELVAGRKSIDRVINRVTVMESPWTSYQADGVFLLTTFYIYHDNPSLISEAVKMLAQKEGISALAIKQKKSQNAVEIPSDITDIADEYDLPLFIIRDEAITFSDVISAITSEIVNYQFNIFKEVNTQHKTLYNAILNGYALSYFMKSIGDNLQRNCTCLSKYGEVLAAYIASRKHNNDNLNVLIQTIIKRSLGDNKQPFQRLDSYYIFPCLVQKQVMGYFVLEHPEEISEYELSIAQQMVSFISIKLLEKHLSEETEQRMTKIIVDELLFKHQTDENNVKERLTNLGLVPDEFFCITYFVMNVPEYTSGESDLQGDIRSMSFRFKRYFHNSIVQLRADGFFAIISFTRDSNNANPQGMKERLLELVDAEKSYGKVDVGFSRAQTNYLLIPNSYKESKQARKFGYIFSPRDRVYFYNDFFEARVASGALNTEEHAFITEIIVLPIKNYDKKKRTELWLTMEKCFLSDTLENAAIELHIHISTLRYRLQKIQRLTGADYFTAQGRYQLNFAYTITKLLEDSQ